MKKTLLYMIGAALTLAACGTQIDEDERLTYVKPAAVGKNVLLVDFTGQRCVNCPTATEEIEALQAQYGADTVIAVGMHSGPLGFYGNPTAIGLSTATGENYYNQWNIEYQPQGVIDYLGKSDYTSWAGIVYQELQKTAPVQIDIRGIDGGTSASGTITLTAFGSTVSGNLQLWVTEDSITAMQMMPTGNVDHNYMHNHVFRAAVNGESGEPVSVPANESREVSFSFDYAESWVPAHLWVVAFVYDKSGVLQVKRGKLQ